MLFHSVMKQAACRYGKAFVWVILGALVAGVAAHFFNAAQVPFSSEHFVRLLRVGAASFFAAATLGRCGWDIQTWGGDSPAERWNMKIFRLLYVAGFVLVIFTFLVRPT
jgi:hypothetical protein